MDQSNQIAAAKQTTLWQNRKCLIIAFTVASFGFQYGLDVTAVGSFQAMPGFLKEFGYFDESLGAYNIGVVPQQLISSLMQLGGFLTTLSAGFYGAYIGRKTALQIGTIVCVVGLIIMCATSNLAGLYTGRLILGLANGMFMSQTQLYLQEVTPAHLRGQMIGVYSVWVSVASLVGTIVVNYTTKITNRWSYQIPLIVLMPIPVVVSIALIFFPESPRWLASVGKRDQAAHALRRLRAGLPEELIQAEVDEMFAAIEAEKKMLATVSWFDLWKGVDRRRTILSLCVCLCQPASGAMFFIMYGTYFFEMANVGEPFQDSVILCAVGVAAMLVACYVVRVVTRRWLMGVPPILGVISQLVAAAVYTANPGTQSTGKVLVAMGVLFIVAYDLGVGIFAWAVAGELPSQRLRSHTLGAGQSLAFLGAWLTVFTTPYFVNPTALNWGPKYCYIWMVCNMMIVVFVYFFLPETKDRTLEEIDEMFNARVPAKQFSKYVCKGRATQVDYLGEEKYDEKLESQHTENVSTLDRV